MSEDEDGALKDCEIIALKVDMDLVPEWSNVVERIGLAIGERVASGVQGGEFMVKVAIKPERKPQFYAEVKKVWDQFTTMRKQQGRWS